MQRMMPRTFRHSALVGMLLLLGALMVAPSAAAIPKDGPSPPPPGPIPPVDDRMPDLVVAEVRHGWAGPFLGYYTDAKILNRSNVDIHDTFYVRDDSSWNKTVRVTSGIPGGSHYWVRFYRYTCESSGTIHADAFRQIGEYNERNNARFWLLVC